MKYLKRFNESVSFITDYDEIMATLDRILDQSWTRNRGWRERVTIHPDGVVDMEGDLIVSHVMNNIPIKFGHVSGSVTVMCSGLKSLHGCPTECEHFNLTGRSNVKDLKGGPQFVSRIYYVPRSVTSLEGSPISLEGSFDASGCNHITSLEGGPKEVGGCYSCGGTWISDLIGGPEEVEYLSCEESRITSLDGFPKRVKIAQFSCTNLGNSIWDPTPMKDSTLTKLYLYEGTSRLYELLSIFRPGLDPYERTPDNIKEEVTKKFLESLDYNYIRGTSYNPQIDLFRFKEALNEFDIVIREKKLRYYQFIDEEGRVVDFDGNPI